MWGRTGSRLLFFKRRNSGASGKKTGSAFIKKKQRGLKKKKKRRPSKGRKWIECSLHTRWAEMMPFLGPFSSYFLGNFSFPSVFFPSFISILLHTVWVAYLASWLTSSLPISCFPNYPHCQFSFLHFSSRLLEMKVEKGKRRLALGFSLEKKRRIQIYYYTTRNPSGISIGLVAKPTLNRLVNTTHRGIYFLVTFIGTLSLRAVKKQN